MKKSLGILATALVVLSMGSACSGLKPHSAPFYAYNSSLLNHQHSGGLEGHKVVRPVLLVDPNSAYADASTSVESAPVVAAVTEEPAQQEEVDGTDVVDAPEAETALAAAPAPAPVVEAAPAPAPVVAAAAPAPAPAAPEKKAAPAPAPAVAVAPVRDQSAESRTASYLRATYEANGVSFAEADDDGVSSLHQAVKKRGTIYHATRPAVGDIVFFHNTFDRNGDGRNNDWYTHAGLVENVEKDGTIHVLTYQGNKVSSFAMNLEQPGIATDERSGKTWNASVRSKGNGDAPFTQYLAGELFAGFGNLLGDRTELVVIDNWQPGMMVSQR